MTKIIKPGRKFTDKKNFIFTNRNFIRKINLISLGILVVLINIISINAISEMEFHFDGSGNLIPSGTSSDLQKTMSFAFSNDYRVSDEQVKAIDSVLGEGTNDELGIRSDMNVKNVMQARKTVLNSLRYHPEILENPYLIDNLEKLKEFSGNNLKSGTIIVRDEEIEIRRDVDYPSAYSDDYERIIIPKTAVAEYNENENILEIESGKGTYLLDSLEIRDIIVDLKGSSKLKVSYSNENLQEPGKIEFEIQGKSDIEIGGSFLNDIKDSKFIIDKDYQVEYAEFTSAEGDDYSLGYNNRVYNFKLNKNGKL
ncbi:hypothetical protein GF386_01145, partial [Candidatus Pacearchaeota archaeon]|nr:hypothetical protein [Candidatus Pacearchaeota archaeon]